MKIDVRTIKPAGLDVDYEIPAEYIGLTKEDYVRFISPLHVKAHLDKAKDVLLSWVHVKGRFASLSSRSKVPVERDWEIDFTLDIILEADTTFIDFDDEVRQEVIMNLPMRVFADGEENEDSGLQDVDEALFDDEKDGTYEPFADLQLKEFDEDQEDEEITDDQDDN
jgi:uncharacterized metal-binding protein YceD (DUF177 family)